MRAKVSTDVDGAKDDEPKVRISGCRLDGDSIIRELRWLRFQDRRKRPPNRHRLAPLRLETATSHGIVYRAHGHASGDALARSHGRLRQSRIDRAALPEGMAVRLHVRPRASRRLGGWYGGRLRQGFATAGVGEPSHGRGRRQRDGRVGDGLAQQGVARRHRRPADARDDAFGAAAHQRRRDRVGAALRQTRLGDRSRAGRPRSPGASSCHGRAGADRSGLPVLADGRLGQAGRRDADGAVHRYSPASDARDLAWPRRCARGCTEPCAGARGGGCARLRLGECHCPGGAPALSRVHCAGSGSGQLPRGSRPYSRASFRRRSVPCARSCKATTSWRCSARPCSGTILTWPGASCPRVRGFSRSRTILQRPRALRSATASWPIPRWPSTSSLAWSHHRTGPPPSPRLAPEAPPTAATMTADALFHALAQDRPADAVLVQESLSSLKDLKARWPATQPDSYYTFASAGLGYGLRPRSASRSPNAIRVGSGRSWP